MNAADKSKVNSFAESLRNRLGNNVRQIILFGSRARGDSRVGSDFDFVIVLGEKNRHYVESIRDTEVEFLNQYDELSASLVYDEEEWQRRRRLPIGVNVEREGISL